MSSIEAQKSSSTLRALKVQSLFSQPSPLNQIKPVDQKAHHPFAPQSMSGPTDSLTKPSTLSPQPVLSRRSSSSAPLPSLAMPSIEDDGKKPPYSFATLIAMAILRAPHRRLTLAQICNWISETFAYYRDQGVGWKNSIRHNLSVNKAFVKKEVRGGAPGKGKYWAVEAGHEDELLKGRRRGAPKKTPKIGVFEPPPTSSKAVQKRRVSTTQAAVVSSDATEVVDFGSSPIPLSSIAWRSSPPVIPALHSSSAVAQMMQELPRLPRERGAGGWEEDRRRIKRGRAEEDIARIRRSRRRLDDFNFSTDPSLLVSSPVSQQLHSPCVIAPVQQRSRSASPNTSLRRHREKVKQLVGSPCNLPVLEEDMWSSAFGTELDT